VRARGDLVSFFRSPFQRKKDKNINSNKDPLTQHSTHILDNNKNNIIYGNTKFMLINF
jgi:hypothetical protein